MSFLSWYSPNVRAALQKPAALGPNVFVALLLAGIFSGTLLMAKQFAAPAHPEMEISLSFSALPLYALLSLGRGFAAYFLSLAFTLVYGTIAAHNQRAERLMLPLLDILQAIPVLGFLPGVVLALMALFPGSQFGLELASILMVFTGQVWNMTFSFHESLRSIPQSLREVAALEQLNGWETFRILEVPSAMIGLVWNSMMSMAGGWCFLTITEAFTLGSRDFRLPGLGSYMREAIDQNNVPAMLAGVATMVFVIVVVDQLVWRPIVAWSDRYKLSDTAEGEAPRSWALDLLRHSALFSGRVRATETEEEGRFSKYARGILGGLARIVPTIMSGVRIVTFPLRWALSLALVLFMLWSVYSLARLLVALPLAFDPDQADWLHVFWALLYSFIRTSSACLLGVLWTLPVGIMIGLSAKWARRLQPVIQVVASFPAPMLFPLVTTMIVVLQIPFTAGCVALMLLGTQWYILFNVIAGASSIPNDLKEVARVNRLSTWEVWTQLYIPATFPFLVTGLVTAAGGAWNATIVSEYVKLGDREYHAFGLGWLINRALADTAQPNYPLLAACVVTMAACVVTINRLLWKQLYRLAANRYSLNA